MKNVLTEWLHYRRLAIVQNPLQSTSSAGISIPRGLVNTKGESMEKRKFGKLQLTRETLKNLTTEQLDKVAGGRTEDCGSTLAFSECWKCQETWQCPSYGSTYCGDTC